MMNFLKKACGSKICDFFATNRNIASCSEILEIAEYFFDIRGQLRTYFFSH